ncbi:hypothetical protein BJX96DRAFT_167093 [Aspergillus floccosus]
MASSERGRKAINLEPYRDEIILLYSSSTSKYNLQISKRTLKNRLQQWEIRRQDRTITSNSLLHARIRVLFFQVGLEDKELLSVLQKEGFSIFSQAERGAIQGYGKELLHRHIRSKGYIIRRDRLFSAYKTVLPDAVHRRKYDLQRKRGEFVVPRPNFIWSIYCGITARTAVSVLRQYLDTVDDVQLLLSWLRRVQEPNIQLDSCWISGRSTENQRIEAWWEQLSKGALYKWRVSFPILVQDGLFSRSSLADQIAFYAIYVPILRTELCHFPNRPNLIGGKPYMLYHYPQDGVQDYGHSIDNDEAVPFRITYLQLRHILITYIKRYIEPFLALSTRPISALNWEFRVA